MNENYISENNTSNDYIFCIYDKCLKIPEIMYTYNPLNSDIIYRCDFHNNKEIKHIDITEFLEKSSKIKCSECKLNINYEFLHYCKQCKSVFDFYCSTQHEKDYKHDIIQTTKHCLFNDCLVHNKPYIFCCINCNQFLCNFDLTHHQENGHNVVAIIDYLNNNNDQNRINSTFKKQKEILEKIKMINNKFIDSLEKDILIKQRIINNKEKNKYNFQANLNYNCLEVNNNKKYEELLEYIITKEDIIEEKKGSLDKESIIHRALMLLYYSMMINTNQKFNDSLIDSLENIIKKIKGNNQLIKEDNRSVKFKTNFVDLQKSKEINYESTKDKKYDSPNSNIKNCNRININKSKEKVNASNKNSLYEYSPNSCNIFQKILNSINKNNKNDNNDNENSQKANINIKNASFSINNKNNSDDKNRDINKIKYNSNINSNLNNNNIKNINDIFSKNIYYCDSINHSPNKSNSNIIINNNNSNILKDKSQNINISLNNNSNKILNFNNNIKINISNSNKEFESDNSSINKNSNDQKNGINEKINKNIESIFNMIILSSGNIALSKKEAVEIYDFKKLDLSGNNIIKFNDQKIKENNCLIQRINLAKGKRIGYVFEFPDKTLLCSTFSRIFRIKLLNNDLSHDIIGIIKLANYESPTKLISLGNSLLIVLSELKNSCYLKAFIKKEENNKSDISESNLNNSIDVDESSYKDSGDQLSNDIGDVPPIGNGLFSKKSIEVDESFKLYPSKNLNKDRKLLLSIEEIKKNKNDEYLYEFICTSNEIYNRGEDKMDFYGVKEIGNGKLYFCKIKTIKNISCSIHVNSICQLNDKYICVGLQNHDLIGQISGFAIVDIYTREICRVIRDDEINSLYFIKDRKLLIASMEVRDAKKNFFMTKIYKIGNNRNDKGEEEIDFKSIYNYKNEHHDNISTVIEFKSFCIRLIMDEKEKKDKNKQQIIIATSSHDSSIEVLKTFIDN